MGLKEIWNKTSFARKAAEDKKRKEEDEILRKEVKEAIKPEIEAIMMEKIRKEEIAKAKGEFKEEKKKNPFAALGEEFKQSNIGSTEQMNKMLGKTSNTNSTTKQGFNMSGETLKDTSKLSEMLGGRSIKTKRDYTGDIGLGSVQKERDIPGMLGKNRELRSDFADTFGIKKNKKKSTVIEVENARENKARENTVGGFANDSKESGEQRIKRILGKR